MLPRAISPAPAGEGGAGLANASGHVEPHIAYAVLSADRPPRLAGQVVFASPDAIAALVAAGGATAATQVDLDLSNPFHYALPPAAPSPEA